MLETIKGVIEIFFPNAFDFISIFVVKRIDKFSSAPWRL